MKVLDHGYIELIDCMPSNETCDNAVINAARISYSKGTTSKRTGRGLIRYLMRNWHTSPFEMVEFKFSVCAPLMVARQWVRHRTASWNEESARYSEVDDNPVYMPHEWRGQSEKNKQAGEGVVDMTPVVDEFGFIEPNGATTYADLITESKDVYKRLNSAGVERGLCRLACTEGRYTRWIWKIDLHNLLHFLQLRMHPHAQWEIRQYANAIAGIVAERAPLVWEAFECYRLHAITLSAEEQLEIQKPGSGDLTDSEREEFRRKMKRMELRL